MSLTGSHFLRGKTHRGILKFVISQSCVIPVHFTVFKTLWGSPTTQEKILGGTTTVSFSFTGVHLSPFSEILSRPISWGRPALLLSREERKTQLLHRFIFYNLPTSVVVVLNHTFFFYGHTRGVFHPRGVYSNNFRGGSGRKHREHDLLTHDDQKC